MGRLAGAFVVAVIAFFVVTAVASSQGQAYNGQVAIGFKGWGSVKLGKGMLEHRTVRCTRESCPAVTYVSRGSRVILSERPYDGWKFTRWHGACKDQRARCLINVAKVRRNAYGDRQIHVSATFAPVAQGLTSDHPIPLGSEASAGRGWRVRVNSVEPDAQLLPPAPSGADYFAANVTIRYLGGGSATPENDLTWQTIGNHHTPYNPGSSPCPNLGPQPPLDTYDPVPSGQSTSGNVCWRIAANDASSLKLFFGSGTLNYPGTTWFALH